MTDAPRPRLWHVKVPGLGRTSVEWVDLYTRQTLLALLWLTIIMLLFGATPVLEANPTAMAVLVVMGLVVALAATRTLRVVSEAWPGAGPTPVRAVLEIVAVSAVAAAVSLALPEDPRRAGLTIVWSGLLWSLAGLRDRRHLAVLLVVLTGGVLAETGDPGIAAATAFGAIFIGFTVHMSLWMLEVVRRLDRSRDTEAALAVAEERLRFSRDVHDVLGRHLSTIAVRAELAAALSRRGDPGAGAMMMEVRASAHDALREARELARGYRASNLDQELEGATSLLAAAGIATDVDVTDLPTRWHEPAAWVVREAVTNVLRHSSASAVEITWRGGVLSVANDGALAPAPGNGVGLVGLGERLAPLGALVSTTHRDDRWTLAVTMPADVREPAAQVGR